MPKKYKVLDLFCGAGGMAEGFMRAGFIIPYATDISKDASKTYINRHKQLGKKVKFLCEDINKIANEKELKKFLKNDINSIDVICGGPPCQGFSLAGRRDKNDPRNKLVFSYLEILKIVKPKFFVMENVEGLLSTICEEYTGMGDVVFVNKPVIEILQDQFKKIGYDMKYKVLQACDYGIPQKRKRVIFLGRRCDINLIEPEFPSKRESVVTVEEAIGDLIDISNGEEISFYKNAAISSYQIESRLGRTKNIQNDVLNNHRTSKHTQKVIERFSLIKPGENLQHFFSRICEEDRKRYYTKKNNCTRLKSDGVSPTITTLPDDIIHYSENRILTVREMARLQSFDDSFVFLGKRTTGGKLRKKETPQYTQVGNAVPPILAYEIAKEVIKALRGSEANGE